MIFSTINVNLPHHSYPIYIGQQLLTQSTLLLPHIAGHQVMVVTQDTVAALYLSSLQRLLPDHHCDVLLLPQGEQHKNLAEWQKILEALLEGQHERSTTLIALGGGMVGDMTGFAAACYQRGVHYIQIPTTVIGQVDAAIGGKTAVNHRHGKNRIGAFYQPQCVIADIDTLLTLSMRDYVAGLAEVVKYGLIADATFFAWIEANLSALLNKNPDILLQAVSRSVEIKAAIVMQDEKEQDLRRVLNFGHTFGHALEVASEYQGLLHGEAVAIGMRLAAELSAALGWITAQDVQRIADLLQAMSLARYDHLPAVADFVQLMRQDKKVHARQLHFVLLKGIGQAVVTDVVTEQQLIDVITSASSRR